MKRKSAVVRAFLWRPFVIDHTQIALIPGGRTALLLIAEWSILGVGNPTSTAFQLGCLYVGLSEPNGSLGLRFRFMGMTLASCVFMGALLPSLLWDKSAAANIAAAFAVSFVAGLSPISGSQSLVLGTKLGTALYAINGGVNRNTQGYGDFGTSVLFTFIGGALSLALALLPEIVGNRDAVRTDLFKVWNGFGKGLARWSSAWGTSTHLGVEPIPAVTLAVAQTEATIAGDAAEESGAKAWLLRLVEGADTIRAGCFCLSHMSHTTPRATTKCKCCCGSGGDTHQQGSEHETDDERQKDIDAFFSAVGRACRCVAFAVQFPWMFRYVVPFVTMGRFDLIDRSVAAVGEASAALLRQKKRPSQMTDTGETQTQQKSDSDSDNGDNDCSPVDDLISSLVSLIKEQVESVAKQVKDATNWPRYSSPLSIPQRLALSVGRPTWQGDNWKSILGYALRFAIAYSIATIPEVTIGERVSAHWFPMTVTLIMNSTHAATYQRVAHRTVGTLLGIFLGSALVPLFRGSDVDLIVLLGLVTYASVVFFPANYTFFTFFITGYVFVTAVGAGGSFGTTSLYRCVWTLSAALLVVIVTNVFPPRIHDRVGDNLAAMAKAIKAYAEASVAANSFRVQIQDKCTDEGDFQAAEEAAAKVLAEARRNSIKARVALLKRIHESNFTPEEGYLVEPGALAHSLASDLIDAAIVLQTVSLVAANGGNASYLLSDIDQDTYGEIERLIARLEENGNLLGALPDSTTQQQSALPSGSGLFSSAIARAHQHLDEAGIPRLSSANDRHIPSSTDNQTHES